MAKDRARDVRRSVGSHQEIMGALGRASASDPSGVDRLWKGGEFQRRVPETHVNVTPEKYHRKWTTTDSNADYDDHAQDESRYRGTMPR